jgi:hypothetical protein
MEVHAFAFILLINNKHSSSANHHASGYLGEKPSKPTPPHTQPLVLCQVDMVNH